MTEEIARREETRTTDSRRKLRHERERERRKKGILEHAVILVVAFVLVFGVIKPFVVDAFMVPSESMVPTLKVGDRFLANKFVYRFTQPERGDIVVFDSVEEGVDEVLVKRVAGLPGDVVQVRGGALFVNGEPQNEPHLNTDVVPDLTPAYGPTEVPEGKIFVLGDNRGNSGDSRFFGFVPTEEVKGEAFLRFWPLTRVGILRSHDTGARGTTANGLPTAAVAGAREESRDLDRSAVTFGPVVRPGLHDGASASRRGSIADGANEEPKSGAA